MEPAIEERGSFTVLGVQALIKRGSESPELFAKIWQRFESYGKEIEALSIGKEYYGVNFPTENEGETEYFAGMKVAEDTKLKEGLEKRIVSGSQFAIFECPITAIGVSYQQIFSVWLPSSKEMNDPTVPVFEEYPEKGSMKPVRIHIPVRKRA